MCPDTDKDIRSLSDTVLNNQSNGKKEGLKSSINRNARLAQKVNPTTEKRTEGPDA
jgi:hypothetical protein